MLAAFIEADPLLKREHADDPKEQEQTEKSRATKNVETNKRPIESVGTNEKLDSWLNGKQNDALGQANKGTENMRKKSDNVDTEKTALRKKLELEDMEVKLKNTKKHEESVERGNTFAAVATGGIAVPAEVDGSEANRSKIPEAETVAKTESARHQEMLKNESSELERGPAVV